VTQVEVPLTVIQHVLKDFEKSESGSSASLADKKRRRPTHQRTSTVISAATIVPNNEDEPGVSVMESKSIVHEQIIDLKETIFDCVIRGISYNGSSPRRDTFERAGEDETSASFKVSPGGNGKSGDDKEDDSSSASDSRKSSATSIPDSQEQVTNSKSTEISSRRQDFDRSIEILHVKKGSYLIRQGDRQSNLYLLIHGLLELSVESQRVFSESVKFPTLTDRFAFTIKAGGIAGYISSLTGNPSMISVCAKIDSCVVCVKRSFLERYVEKHHVSYFEMNVLLSHPISFLGHFAYFGTQNRDLHISVGTSCRSRS
jgi:hypothetical protein